MLFQTHVKFEHFWKPCFRTILHGFLWDKHLTQLQRKHIRGDIQKPTRVLCFIRQFMILIFCGFTLKDYLLSGTTAYRSLSKHYRWDFTRFCSIIVGRLEEQIINWLLCHDILSLLSLFTMGNMVIHLYWFSCQYTFSTLYIFRIQNLKLGYNV